MTAYQLWRRIMVQVLLWGAGYAVCRRSMVRSRTSDIVEIAPLISARTRPVVKDDRYYFESEIGGQLRNLDPADVLYFEWMSVDTYSPLDVVKYARDTFATGLAALQFTNKFYGRGGRLGGILKIPSGQSPKAKDRIESGFRDQYESVDGAFMTIVLRDDVEFHQAQATFEEAQMIEGRRESVKDVARFYGMAPSRLGEEGQSSYNSKSEDNRDYLDTTLAPFLRMITSELNDKVLTPEETWPTNPRDPEYYWEHNTNDLLRMNAIERAQAYLIGRQGEWLSPNDIRRAENMAPIPGGDRYTNPNTSSGVDTSGAREAFAQLFVDNITRLADASFDRAVKRAENCRKYEDFVTTERTEREDRVRHRFCELGRPATRLYDLSTEWVNDLVGAYTAAVEDRFNWTLDNVSPNDLERELTRLRGEARDDLTGRINEIVGAW